MTDIRARLADALREHDYNAMMYGDKKSYEEQADVLLSLPGIAIVDSGELDLLRAQVRRLELEIIEEAASLSGDEEAELDRLRAAGTQQQ